MIISPRLAKALQRALGEEASEDLMAMFEARDSQFAELKADVAELRHEMRVGFEKVRADISETRSELMKWSFVFWVGAVTTIAVLFRTLR